MQLQPDLLFLQATSTPPQQGSIQPEHLTATAPSHYEVPNATEPHFRQFLGYQGGKLQLLIQGVSSDRVKVKENNPGYSYLIPVDDWLRSQLDIIEHYAQRNVDLTCYSPAKTPFYRPLWRGNMMYVHIAPWCNFLRQNLNTGSFETFDCDTLLGRGTYNISVEVPSIFIGSHKKGENFSLSVEIVQVVFYPEKPALPSIKPRLPEKKGRPRKDKLQHVAQAQEAEAGIPS